MPRFFFDIHEDSKLQRDEDGIELADISDVRKQAQCVLPEIAYNEIPGDGDRKTYVV